VRLCVPPPLRFVVGIDCAFSKDGQWCYAVAVVWDVDCRRVVEAKGAKAVCRFPYVPGYLSFRELPAVLAALRRVQHRVDAVMCDGQGIAHPRRLGLASHLGVIIDLPTVGCAKSRLIGTHQNVRPARGAWVGLFDGKEKIGAVVRSRDGVRPLYVSVGHRMDLESAVALVLRCSGGYRLPEPTRLADRLVARYKADGVIDLGSVRGRGPMRARVQPRSEAK
jgi:deoxyribonuclease V